MIQPLREYVLLEKIAKEQKVGSIIIATKKEEENDKAVVVAVGSGQISDGKVIPIDVKVGDTVLFKKYSTTEYEEDNKKYLLIKNQDIIAIIK